MPRFCPTLLFIATCVVGRVQGNTYTLVGQGACVDASGSHGTLQRSSDSSDPHTNCQTKCNSLSTCTGYDDRAQGCLYYSIQIARANDGANQKCYRKDSPPSNLPSPSPPSTGYICSAGTSSLSGTQLCTSSMASSCSDATCCTAPKTCATYQAIWLIAQATGGCSTDTKFYDRKKPTTVVAAPHGEAEIKAACCTPFADAKCSDWLDNCPAGKVKIGTKSAPADGDGKSISNAKFNSDCCEDPPKTCATYQASWLLAQATGGCSTDTKFYDRKKPTTVVAAPHGEAEIKAACCTPFADAKCSDWLDTCPQGQVKVAANSAPADGDGKSISEAKFRQHCCITLFKCRDWTSEQDADGSASLYSASQLALLLAVIAASTGIGLRI